MQYRCKKLWCPRLNSGSRIIKRVLKFLKTSKLFSKRSTTEQRSSVHLEHSSIQKVGGQDWWTCRERLIDWKDSIASTPYFKVIHEAREAWPLRIQQEREGYKSSVLFLKKHWWTLRAFKNVKLNNKFCQEILPALQQECTYTVYGGKLY